MHLYIYSTNWNYGLKDEQDQAWPKGVPRLVSRQKEKPHTIVDTSMKQERCIHVLQMRPILKSRFLWRKKLGPEEVRGKGKDKQRSSNFVQIEVSASPGRNLEYEVSSSQSCPWMPCSLGQAKDSQRAQIQIYANLQKAFWADLTSYVIKHTRGKFHFF